MIPACVHFPERCVVILVTKAVFLALFVLYSLTLGVISHTQEFPLSSTIIQCRNIIVPVLEDYL